MKNRKIYRLLAGLAALALIAVILLFTNAAVGNPVSAAQAKKAALKHVAENYPHLNLETEKPLYNFKNSDYIVRAVSRSSIDTHFNIYYQQGKIRDDYEFMVSNKFNTIDRLNREYTQLVRDIIGRELGYQDNHSWVNYTKDSYENLDKAIELDMKFSRSLPLTAEVNIDVRLHEATLANAARLLEEAHAALLQNGCIFVKYGTMSGTAKDVLNIYNVNPAQIESGNLLDLITRAAARDGGEYEGISVFIKADPS